MNEHIDWARSIAAKVARRLPTWFTVDDLTGPAESALLERATRFDPSRGVPFRAFASQTIRHRCIDAIRRREYKERAHYALSTRMNPDSERGELARDVPDTAPSPFDLAALGELQFVWRHVNYLPLRHRQLIVWVYRESRGLRYAAERFGVTESRASQLHREALELLKQDISILRRDLAA